MHVWRCLVFLQQVAAHANEAWRWMELYRLYQQQVEGFFLKKKKKRNIHPLSFNTDLIIHYNHYSYFFRECLKTPSFMLVYVSCWTLKSLSSKMYLKTFNINYNLA